jgi:hypothetical protein
MEGKILYFLHIPKTSGMKMQYELAECAKNPNAINSPRVYLPGEFEFVFDPYIAESHNIICGHFGRNPIDTVNNVITFSMIREPFEQYLSLAKYAALQDGVTFDNEFLDAFLNNNNEINSRFEGMSGCENPQSCFLYSKIAGIEKQVGVDDFGNPVIDVAKSFFIEKPKSYADLKQRLEDVIIGITENRNQLVESVNKILMELFNTSIEINSSVINKTPTPSFRLNKKQVVAINNKIELDIELYSKVKESLYG